MPPKVNITKNSENDKYERYTRDLTVLRYIKSKGTLTLLVNITLIAKQLNVKLADLVKFIKKGLAAAVIANGLQTDICINGRFTVAQIEALIIAFTHKYVLCLLCGLPELISSGQCKACGHTPLKKKIKNDDLVSLFTDSNKDDNGQDVIKADIKTVKEEYNTQEFSMYMHKLYDERLLIKSSPAVKNNKLLARIDKLLDSGWRVNTQMDLDSWSSSVDLFFSLL